MEKFTTLTGVAAPLPMINVDTDMIIPKQFLKTIKRTGLGKSLFYEMRYRRRRHRRTRISCSTSRPTARPRSWSPATISAAARPASTRLGAARFRHPLRHRAELRRHLLSTTASRTASCRSSCRQEQVDKLMDDAERGANARLTVDLEKPGDHAARTASDDPFRRRSVPQALPAQRPRRHRPDAAEGGHHRRLRRQAEERRPALALSR